jgi:hypothetical protein
MKRVLIILATIALLSSCGMTTGLTRGTQYPLMYKEKPVTLLVMPPINNTTNVEAKDLLYTSISKPLIDAGYYVIPPMITMEVLKEESAYDSEIFVDSSLDMFKTFFGADAVVLSEINKWAKVGVGIDADIRYFIRSATTGQILFDRSCDLFLDLSSDSDSDDNKKTSLLSVLVDLATTAINTAMTDHIVAARKANNYIFEDLPRGKYSPQYMQDMDVHADEMNISKTVK